MWVLVLQQHLSILILFASVIVPVVSGMQFVFQVGGGDFDLQSDNRSVPPSWSNNRLWLTPDPDTTKTDRQSRAVGRVVYNHALPLFNNSTGKVVSFNTSFNFTIVAACAYGYCGDGLAFSISPLHELPAGTSGAALGIAAENVTEPTSLPNRHLFAVEFDTYMNPQYSDPSSSHIGIDFNGLTSNYTLDTLLLPDLYLYNNYTIFAWVEYIASLHQILVLAANSSARPSTPCLNATYNLSDLFAWNQSLYAAISASSGLSVQGTALFSWSFASEDDNTPAPPPSLNSPAPLPDPSRFNSPPAPPSSLKSPALPPSLTSPFPSPPSVFPLTAISLSSVLILAAGWGLVALVYKRRKQMFSQRFSAVIEMIPASTGSVPRHSYKELKKATQGFSDKQKVGEGGYSNVYKGTLSTGEVVAVKRLKEGLRMEVEFASEIQIISQIRHRNLLQLRGWGYERGKALLVYQYMSNGSLDSYLYGKKSGNRERMDGEKRLNILVGVAAALEYLHEGLGECVLHRDVKAANVMLTESFQAMLGDFGMARLIMHNQVVTMTAVGTPGYMAPEVVYTGRATDKADVYSFGLLALEVACGRRVTDESLPPQEMRLLDWVWLLQQSGKLMDALDPACSTPHVKEHEHYHQHIQAEVADCTDHSTGQSVEEHVQDIKPVTTESLQELMKKWQCVLHVAMLCCNPWPEDRPTMRQVYQTLRESLVLPLPSTKPTYSRSPSMPPSTIFSIFNKPSPLVQSSPPRS